jgi:hypothetical protein
MIFLAGMKRYLMTSLVLLGPVSMAIADPKPYSPDPKPYSPDRYSLLWQGAGVFEKTIIAAPAVGNESGWEVVGVFSFGEEEGAIVMNRIDGRIEYLNTSSPSPSGMILSQIAFMDMGQNPRIDVMLEGRRLTLSGSTGAGHVPENVALKYTPTTIAPPSPSIALLE